MGEKTELKACPFDDGLRKHRVMVERQQGRAGTACPSKWFRERVACSCGARGAEFKRPGRAIAAWNTRAQPTPQDQRSLPDGWGRDEMIERICIGLFADYDDLPFAVAAANWNAGYAYGAVGSDAHREIVQTASRVAEAILPDLPSVHAEKG